MGEWVRKGFREKGHRVQRGHQGRNAKTWIPVTSYQKSTISDGPSGGVKRKTMNGVERSKMQIDGS